ncbi:MAG: type I restriction enzyme HsdR N-terminal domain-containing protein [Bacteroidia bacterium]
MLIYPEYPIRLRKNKDATEVWDIIRKQWIQLTPEELVRQHFINYLIQEKKYPIECILVEKELAVFNTQKRFDVAIIDKNQNFLLVAECKAPSVNLDEKVIQQILTYNLVLNAQYLVITNGLKQFVFKNDNNNWIEINDVVIFNQL